jgi:hypothetical protein
MNSPHTLHFEEFINNFEKNDQLNEKQNLQVFVFTLWITQSRLILVNVAKIWPFGITTDLFPEFSSFIASEVSQNIANVSCAKRVTLPPHSELGLWGKLVKNILFGYQDICENDKQGLSQSIYTLNYTIPVNPGKCS